jgi:CRISPR-associated protein Cas5d
MRMEHTDKEYCLEVWGDYACFTRPELKVERVSYDVITPSAARAIFDAVFWKPAISWEITKIEVLNPIKWFSIRRNEVGALASTSKKQIFIEDSRQQRNALMLKDVRYRIHALQHYIPVGKRSKDEMSHHQPGNDENPGKYNAIFERRAAAGQCFNQPYFGTRECEASFKLVDNDVKTPEPIQESKDLGIMFYDWEFKDADKADQMFFRASLENGVVIVPPKDSEDILR